MDEDHKEPKISIICHFCNKLGHMKKECWKFAQSEAGKGGAKNPKRFRHTVNASLERKVFLLITILLVMVCHEPGLASS